MTPAVRSERFQRTGVNKEGGTSETQFVSVVVPNLNKGGYVREAIESILHQSYENFELLFVDNGSTDGSREIAKEYSERDRRVVLHLEPRRGSSHALNKGLSESRGDLITFLGSDDICNEHRLREQVRLLAKNPEIGGCHSNGWIIDASGKPTGEIYHRDIVPLPAEGYDGNIFHQLLRRNFVIGGSVMFRRGCVKGNSSMLASNWVRTGTLTCESRIGISSLTSRMPSMDTEFSSPKVQNGVQYRFISVLSTKNA